MVKKIALLIVPLITFGATYKIIEPDVLSEAERRQDKAIKTIEREAKREYEEFKKLKGEPLAKATKTYAYYVNPIYTLKDDIPRVDQSGRVVGTLYPKGYQFNPLEYIRIAPPPIIVFNACMKTEVDFVKRISANRPDAMLASSGCEIEDFPKDIGKQLYLVTKEMKEKFELKYTVSVVTVDMKAKRIKVEVYKVDK